MDLGTPVGRLLPESRREMACGLGGSRGEGGKWVDREDAEAEWPAGPGCLAWLDG